MTTPEDRLRDALAASAALVQLEEHPVGLVLPAAAHRRGHWYAPVAVAIAVLAVLVAGVLVARRNTSGPAAPSPVRPSTARFFTDLEGLSTVTVAEVGTGRVTATLKPPSGMAWGAVSATANPLMFYVAAQQGVNVNLYRFMIDDRGHTRSLTRVSTFPSGSFDLVALAASPDGTRIAYPVANSGKSAGYGPAEIDVLTLSGKWTIHPAYRTPVTGRVSDLSWSADGRYLAFELEASSYGTDTMWVLDTHAGHALIADSHRFPGWQGNYTAPILSADGNDLYAIAGWTVRDMDVRTGRLRRTLKVPHSRYSGNGHGATLLARDPSGRLLLVLDGTGHAQTIDIASGATTPVPLTRGGSDNISW